VLAPATQSIPVEMETSTAGEGVAQVLPGLRLAEVKVFSATKRKDRDTLGDLATEWLRAHDEFDDVSVRVTLSSDLEYHCLSITLLCWRKA
jgi:hypothetical protein